MIEFQKKAMREAMDSVYSWKQEHPDQYSRFSVEMMKMMRNDFSQLERIFKMAVGFVPTYVLIECQKLLVHIRKTFSLPMKEPLPPVELSMS